MFYDLNIHWSSINDPELPCTLAFLAELGYDVVALNHTITGKVPAELTCPIPDPLPFPIPNSLRVLRRLTIPLTIALSNSRLKSLSATYDILALRPTDEKTLQAACSSLDCALISLDLTQRLGYHFKFKPLAEAIKRGARFEIAYSQAVVGDSQARRTVISNATQLIRATRGRGLVVSSETRRAIECRGPWDVINLLATWGLKQEIGFEAVSKEARGVVVRAGIQQSGWRGVVDIIQGLDDKSSVHDKVYLDEETREKSNPEVKKATQIAGSKRKAEDVDINTAELIHGEERQISKREMKRRAKKAKQNAI